MARLIQYIGAEIKEDNLIIGNHCHAQIVIKGDFSIHGLVYCPRYKLDLFIKGNGTISLHGVCKQLNIVKVKGNCLLDLESLLISDLNCRNMMGNSILKIGKVRTIGEKNMGMCEVYRDGRRLEFSNELSKHSNNHALRMFW
jgi:hypothetical protein